MVRDGAGNVTFQVDPDGTSFHRGKETFASGVEATGTHPISMDNAAFCAHASGTGSPGKAETAFPPNTVFFYGRDNSGGSTAGAFISVSAERPGIYTEKKLPSQAANQGATEAMDEQLEILAKASSDTSQDLPAEFSHLVFQQPQSLPSIWGVSSLPNTEAILGQNSLSTSTSAAMRGVHIGLGVGVNGQIANANSTAPAVWGVSNGRGSGLAASMTGTGVGLIVDHNGAQGNIAQFRSNNVTVARLDKTGRGFFNGGTQMGGADLAEAFTVEGAVSSYEPGDVLVISTSTDRTVERSSEPYSTLVAGVYATKTGVLLSEGSVEDAGTETVPLGVVGVIPTKVSSENGPIHRGDLLVTSSLPGHAMRGTDRDRMIGAVLGKALENFDGPETGMIKLLVNVN
ncbi:MAG: hypothetical protein HY650_06350 [Acidobacteria bacterium]|nr:hypothetical protein [Acidobacteriota bacterium]